MMKAMAPKKRIVILGGGFGGVSTAYHLERLLRRRSDVEIVLVSRDNFVLMTPCSSRCSRDRWTCAAVPSLREKDLNLRPAG
jgi:NADH dehydrogenase FAD-containing subunit